MDDYNELIQSDIFSLRLLWGSNLMIYWTGRCSYITRWLLGDVVEDVFLQNSFFLTFFLKTKWNSESWASLGFLLLHSLHSSFCRKWPTPSRLKQSHVDRICFVDLSKNKLRTGQKGEQGGTRDGNIENLEERSILFKISVIIVCHTSKNMNHNLWGEISIGSILFIP